MNEKKSKNSGPWRRLVFLLPAALMAFLVAFTLPNTQPVLAEVPALLEYEPTPTPEAREKVDRSAEREEAEAKHANPTAGRSAVVQSFTAPAAYKDGTYTGSAQGFGGTITVSVTVDESKITSIDVLSHSGEDAAYFSQAMTLTEQILRGQSTDLDAVTGATLSSIGLLDAVDAALEKAVG